MGGQFPIDMAADEATRAAIRNGTPGCCIIS
jgi:hypothetical protein